MTNFKNAPDLKSALENQSYIASDEIATIMYLSQELGKPLHNLLAMPEDNLVLSGHTSDPVLFHSDPIQTTIGQAKQDIELLKIDEEEFIETVLSKIPDTPPNHFQVIDFNEKGVFPQIDITKLEAGANRCAI